MVTYLVQNGVRIPAKAQLQGFCQSLAMSVSFPPPRRDVGGKAVVGSQRGVREGLRGPVPQLEFQESLERPY